MLKEFKEKVSKKANQVKAWFVENKEVAIYLGICAAWVTGICVWSHKYSKKYNTLWRKAKAALENNDTEYDYGPYKIMAFFEPKTREFLGELPCHVKSVDQFLKLK